jgi:hypothetical protein
MLAGCRRHHKSGEAIHTYGSVKNDELLEGAAMLVVLRRAMTQV